ncbi:DUF1566 domain-containing protein [Bacteroides sp. 519]|nr:DUF1566 domain-containing protein [Bacteroides sp. 519]
MEPVVLTIINDNARTVLGHRPILEYVMIDSDYPIVQLSKIHVSEQRYGVKRVIKFASANYWSSTENSANNAWNVNFSNGNTNNNNKTNSRSVRCAR